MVILEGGNPRLLDLSCCLPSYIADKSSFPEAVFIGTLLHYNTPSISYPPDLSGNHSFLHGPEPDSRTGKG